MALDSLDEQISDPAMAVSAVEGLRTRRTQKIKSIAATNGRLDVSLLSVECKPHSSWPIMYSYRLL